MQIFQNTVVSKYLKGQNRTMALDTWGRIALNPDKIENTDLVRKDLLEYCKLDTLVRLKIYEKLVLLN